MKSSKKNKVTTAGKQTGGKLIRNVRAKLDAEKYYELSEAIDFIKANHFAKFDETLNIAINLGVDPKHSDQMVRGMVSLPAGTGKNVRVAVFAKGDKIKEALDAGADMAGSDELLEQIKAGTINFDRCIATPDMMAVVGAVAKILGPRGLMPNPKLGTVTINVAAAVSAAKAGQVEFKVEKAGIVHGGVGKLSFSVADLKNNIHAFVDAVSKAKPSAAKGTYFKVAHICSSQGPALRLNISSIFAS
jgi:large subunit ribosomal protein L1